MVLQYQVPSNSPRHILSENIQPHLKKGKKKCTSDSDITIHSHKVEITQVAKEERRTNVRCVPAVVNIQLSSVQSFHQLWQVYCHGLNV